MPRPPRQWIAGGIYHVFSRGSNRQAIFKHDSDRIDLLGCAASVVERHGIECLAFGLMPNHCHWLFKIPATDDRLSRAMKELNGRYSLRFNRRYAREAHLFRNRFGAVVQTTHEQLRWTVRYIARNPVEANLCADPAELPWTSHRATALLDPAPPFLAVSTLLSYFGDTTEQAVARYIDFVVGQPANPGV
jgi:putative transposase